MGHYIDDPRDFQPGDYVHVYEYMEMLEDAGFETEYEHLSSDISGYVAKVKVRDKDTGEMKDHAIFDKTEGVSCMMRSVDRELEKFE
jgi:hypothetical protein